MTYHPLTDETGGDTTARMDEKNRLIKIIRDFVSADDMSPKEQGFVEQMENEETYVSPKQLLWLRDIKDRYI